MSGSLTPVAFEHILPERFHFFNVASLAVYWNPGEQQTFGEFTFQAERFSERASRLLRFVFTQPQRVRHNATPQDLWRETV